MEQYGHRKFEELMQDEENQHCFDCGKLIILLSFKLNKHILKTRRMCKELFSLSFYFLRLINFFKEKSRHNGPQ